MDIGSTEREWLGLMEVRKKKKLSAQEKLNLWHIVILAACLTLTVGVCMAVFSIVFGVSILTWDFWIGIGMILLAIFVALAIIYVALVRPDENAQKPHRKTSSKLSKVFDSKLLTRQEDDFQSITRYMYDLKLENLELKRQLKHSESHLDADFLSQTMDAMCVGIIVMNDEKEIVYSNKVAPVSQGIDGETVLDLSFDENDSIGDWIDNASENAIRAEKIWQRVAKKDDDGASKRKYYDLIVSYNRGQESEIVIVAIDQTASYLPEDDDLNFIAFAAHELRGPITVIRGYLDVLNDELAEQLDDDHKELVKRLIVSANRLSSYINNVLNTSRFDQRHLQLVLAEEKLSDVFNGIVDDVSLRAESGGRMLEIDIPEDLPTIAADATSLGEVFVNLIDNAIKYSYEGGLVEIKAETPKGENCIEISVIDHGIGIPVNLLPNLFKKFYRSHRSRETVAGTGIGLYISKAIIESHGGKISVRSVEHEGTTFTIQLPIYESVKKKLDKGDNSEFIKDAASDKIIRNHGAIRG